MVRRKSEEGPPTMNLWRHVIEAGEIHIFDVTQRSFVPAAIVFNSGTGSYQPYVEHDGQIFRN